MPFSSIAAASSRRLNRHGVSSSRSTSSTIGSVLVVPLLLIVLLAIFSTGTEALSSPNPKSGTVPYFSPPSSTSSSSPSNVIAITHAGGRMGKLLALQLREDAEFRRLDRNGDLPVLAEQEEGNSNGDGDDNDDDNDNANDKNGDNALPRIRAIVRSEKEAYSVKCDLGGMTTVGGGGAKPNNLDWLETVVIDADLEASERASLLKKAFKGCRAAILCDASHNELVWNGNETAGGEFSVVVPAAESRDLSKRLLEEINAASDSSTLQHVVLRSTMGLEVSLAAAAHRRYMDTVEPAGAAPLEGAIDWEKLARAMGGEAALAGARESERAFRKMAEQKPSCRHTILRLGALTDDAGMVPLVFGNKDSILIKTTDNGTENYRPPILSRSDAARVSTVLVRKDHGDVGDSNSNAAVNGDSNATFGVNGDSNAGTNTNIVAVDCAWHPKYGRDSVGREETVSAAGRQDLKKAILKALPEPQPITPSSTISQL